MSDTDRDRERLNAALEANGDTNVLLRSLLNDGDLETDAVDYHVMEHLRGASTRCVAVDSFTALVAALILLAIGLGYYVRLQRCGIRLRQEQWRYLRGLSRYDSQTRLAVVDDLPIVIGGNHNPSN